MKARIKKIFKFINDNKNYIKGFIIITLFALIWFKCKHKIYDNASGIYIHDTNTVIKYEKELSKDTVIKWYEKIIYRKSEPDIVYYNRLDTLKIKEIQYKDLMLKVNKENNRLRIYAVNENDSLIKELIFDNVGNNFVASSVVNNIIVKTQKIYFNKIEPYFQFKYNIKDYNKIYDFGVKSGINYMNKIYISPFIEYNNFDKCNFGIEASIKF